jgi:hypothetical protein
MKTGYIDSVDERANVQLFCLGDLENDVSRVDGCDEIWGNDGGRSGGAVSLRTVLVGFSSFSGFEKKRLVNRIERLTHWVYRNKVACMKLGNEQRVEAPPTKSRTGSIDFRFGDMTSQKSNPPESSALDRAPLGS